MKKLLVTIIYGCGAAMVAVLVCIFLSHSHYVPFPDSMLPTALYELALDWLALGTLPMLIASVLMRKVYGTHGAKTALVFLPSAVCAAALLFWLAVWVIGSVGYR